MRTHILNGDALKWQFPKKISGTLIVAKECLVDGDIQGDSIEALFETRENYIRSAYPQPSSHDFYLETRAEFNKISQIRSGSEIDLWFEDDLFCQVNFWFVCHLIKESTRSCSCSLVRPCIENRYNFGCMSEEDLINAHGNRIKIKQNEFLKLAELWRLHQKQHIDKMLEIATELEPEFPFLHPAIQAHIERLPKGDNPGRPVTTLQNIMDELGTDDFASIFRAFCQREAIYGFGDTQVRKMFEQLLS